jgi:hypothetical protein
MKDDVAREESNAIEIRRGDEVLHSFDDPSDKPSKKLVPDDIEPPFEVYRNGTRIAAVTKDKDGKSQSDMDDAHHERETMWTYTFDDGKGKGKSYTVMPGSVWSYVATENAIDFPAEYTVTLNGRTYITAVVHPDRRDVLRHKDGRTWPYEWKD